MKVKVNAYAKINLMLDIINKRTDGYHDLFMIMQSVDVYDVVTVSQSDSKTISITSNLTDIPLDSENIAWKAAYAFFKSQGIVDCGVEINLEKRIPHAAGLAGGSADGAAVITALDKIFNTRLSEKELCKLGAQIGADVPFCLTGGTLLAQGKGDVLSKVKQLPNCFIVLAKPDFGVSTAFAYSQFDKYGKNHTPDKFGMLCAVQSRNIDEICSKMENVFEQFEEIPGKIEIKEILKKNNARGVCMSGSGPTVFGIFEKKDDAVSASKELKDLAADIAVCKPVKQGCKIIEIIE
ncbi:MAG: 4-(cytidine 5'-diphospho)-2-C-methyl-D-erythritol kinase [Clostridiales bacterium]|nr:4-(cytidine 5'-diphospho)-2-C-methyl-D-erythritol kinase [Clostridiales bacterium]